MMATFINIALSALGFVCLILGETDKAVTLFAASLVVAALRK